jgi:hypothetical protein
MSIIKQSAWAMGIIKPLCIVRQGGHLLRAEQHHQSGKTITKQANIIKRGWHRLTK